MVLVVNLNSLGPGRYAPFVSGFPGPMEGGMKKPKTITAYTHAPEPVTCDCAAHPAGARFYVSVIKDPALGSKSDGVLVAGPFATHGEALGWVPAARARVLEAWNPEGRAHWYGYGSVAMPADYDKPGKLNAELGVAA